LPIEAPRYPEKCTALLECSLPSIGSSIFGIGHCSFIINSPYEALAKVSNVHPPQPLPSREGLIYQPSPLVGEGKGERVMDFCKSLLIF